MKRLNTHVTASTHCEKRVPECMQAERPEARRSMCKSHFNVQQTFSWMLRSQASTRQKPAWSTAEWRLRARRRSWIRTNSRNVARADGSFGVEALGRLSQASVACLQESHKELSLTERELEQELSAMVQVACSSNDHGKRKPLTCALPRTTANLTNSIIISSAKLCS